MNIQHLSEKFELNELEQSLVKYLQDHQCNLKSIGIRDMAKDNFTSTSAIYKLCNKFGFAGYSDMIFQLSSTNISSNHLLLTDFDKFSESFTSLLTTYKDKRIIVFGIGFSSPIADYIQQRLTLNGFYAMNVIHIEMFDFKQYNGALLIVISNSGQTPRLTEIVENAHKNNVDIISFIANHNSKLIENSTLPILIGQYNSFTHDTTLPNAFYGEVIIAFESLLLSYLSSSS